MALLPEDMEARYGEAWAIQVGARQRALAVEFGRRVLGNGSVGMASQDINTELFVLTHMKDHCVDHLSDLVSGKLLLCGICPEPFRSVPRRLF